MLLESFVAFADSFNFILYHFQLFIFQLKHVMYLYMPNLTHF